MIFNPSFGGKALPILTNPGTAGDLLEGKQLINQNGEPLTGTIPTKTSSDLTASGSSIIVPAGYYSAQASKSVATATQATPSISVSTAGLITASSTQSAGYVEAGTKSATRQLTTQAGKTVTPSTSTQTAVSSGRYTTGTVYVAGDADLKAANIKSGVNIFGVTGTYSGPNIAFERWTKEGDGNYSSTFSADSVTGSYFYFTVTLANIPVGLLAYSLRIMEGYYGSTSDFDYCMSCLGVGFTDSIDPDDYATFGAGGIVNGTNYSSNSIIVSSYTGKNVTFKARMHSTVGISTINDIIVMDFAVVYLY